MKILVDAIDAPAGGRKRQHPMLRRLVAGASRLLDLLSPHGRLPAPRSPREDAFNLYGDLQRLGGDFDRVLTRVAEESRK